MSQTPRHPPSTALPSDFTAFYAEHAEPLLAFFARRTFEVEVARDLTAETFAEALRARRRFRGTTGEEAGGWLYGIARNKLGHFVRRGVVEQKAVQKLGIRLGPIGPDEHARVVELAGLGDLRSIVAQEFRRLSAEQQAAVQLRIVDELPYGEVAQRLHISEPTARARVSRGLRQLAAALEGSGSTSEVTT
jgi:RNA polymerase sigma factor (sigma-70 family)